MRKPKQKLCSVDLELLRPLLTSIPRGLGEQYVGETTATRRPSVICLSCGATDNNAMIKKHKSKCRYVAHWKAVEYLRGLFGDALPGKVSRKRAKG